MQHSLLPELRDPKETLSVLKRTVISNLSLKERAEFLQFLQNCSITVDLIEKLPLDITTLIFGYFKPEELTILRLVSRTWNRKVTHDSVWRRKCQEYSVIPPSKSLAGNFNTTVPIYHDIFRRAMTACKTWKNLACRRIELHYHTGPVLSLLIVHPTRVITGDINGKIHVFDSQNQKYITCIQAHKGHVSCLAASTRHEKLLASGSVDHTIVIHDLVTFQYKMCLRGHKKPVTALAFSTQRNPTIDSITRKKDYFAPLISGSVDKTIRIWDTKAGVCLRILNGQSNTINSIIYIPYLPPNFCRSKTESNAIQGNKAGYLISGSSDQNIFLWDLKKTIVKDQPEVLSSIMKTHGPISAMAVYNEFLYTEDVNEDVNEDKHLRMRRKLGYGSLDCYVYAKRPIHVPPFLAYAALSDRAVSIFAVPSLEDAQVASLNVHSNTIWSISAAPIHSKLVSTSGDKTAIVWDLKSPKTRFKVGGFDSPVICSAISPQEELLVFGTELGTIVIFDMQEFA
ncbi:WD40-repeat-containing domain protein [Mycotypha africana]|uniref:WD40-repeat-containing domain protein n=1 Tax=Mycotypha africana TaxID=64632 RepID=UPI0023012106|nr:WD40-repeat-containing domain protein [Mycotypha africana]KAI8969919.1 WD40-repeat-containing domain protein [Mycotypha africana]